MTRTGASPSSMYMKIKLLHRSLISAKSHFVFGIDEYSNTQLKKLNWNVLVPASVANSINDHELCVSWLLIVAYHSSTDIYLRCIDL